MTGKHAVITRYWILGIGLLTLIACNEEKRQAQVTPVVATAVEHVREDQLQAGSKRPDPDVRDPYENNQYALNEGKRLFDQYNCSGCHSPGGGGNMGPSLIDDYWIYGSKPANIHDTLVKGRPNGMPSFGGRVPDYQLWQLVSYVRFLGRGTIKQGEK